MTLFDLDDAKSRALVIETGYRIITAPDAPNESRAVEAVTFHFPLFAQILLTDRNRADLDWKSGIFTWRYRNKLTVERTFAIHGYHLIPYVAGEPFLRKPISEVGFDRPLRGLPATCGQTRRIQPILRV